LIILINEKTLEPGNPSKPGEGGYTITITCIYLTSLHRLNYNLMKVFSTKKAPSILYDLTKPFPLDYGK
jgi:hypothetical protein